MPQKIKFEKQYKPIGFGDRADPRTVEGHRNAMAEAAETRRWAAKKGRRNRRPFSYILASRRRGYTFLNPVV